MGTAPEERIHRTGPLPKREHTLINYITKPPVELNESLALLHRAREDIKQHPSIATDTGSTKRTAMHYLTRVVNKLGGTIEVSSHMAAAAILGMPAKTCPHSFQGIYIDAALTYAANLHESTKKHDETSANNDNSSDENGPVNQEALHEDANLDAQNANQASATI